MVLAGAGPAGFSVDEKVGFATVTFTGSAEDVSPEAATATLNAVKAVNGTDGLTVGANGAPRARAAEQRGHRHHGRARDLLFTFGSLVGAFLPVISAVLSLAVGHTRARDREVLWTSRSPHHLRP
jgi:hypothetical protein